MIRITIKQLRQIALDEMRRKSSVNESVDLTSDMLAEALADGIKRQLDGDFATKVVTEFVTSGKKAGMMFPDESNAVSELKSQVSQKVMTRLGKQLQEFVESLVSKSLNTRVTSGKRQTNEAFGSSDRGGVADKNAAKNAMLVVSVESESGEDLPSDYEQCATCGFDHEYEYAEAQKWHEQNPEPEQEIAGECDVCGREVFDMHAVCPHCGAGAEPDFDDR